MRCTGAETCPGLSASAAFANVSSKSPSEMNPSSPPFAFVPASSESAAATFAKSSPFFTRCAASSIFFLAAASSAPGATRASTWRTRAFAFWSKRAAFSS
jgi:hypothetical protein